jgi:hypothetical protein
LLGFLPRILVFGILGVLGWIVGMSLLMLLAVAHGRLVRSTWNALNPSGESFLPRVSDWGLFARGFVLYFAVMFIPAFLWALTIAQPRLPSVEVTTRGKIAESVDKRFNDHPTFEGRLLTHTEGFWYVFDTHDGKIGKLITAPDERVYRIRTLPD